MIAREGKGGPLWTGILLLATGIAVQLQYWSLLPIWYHLVFLVLLVPSTVAGGSLRPRAV